MKGWRIVFWVGASELLLLSALLMVSKADPEGLHQAMRISAEISAGIFLIVFVASSLHRSIRSRWTAALLRERRYIGLSFALSMAIHLAAIFLAYLRTPGTMPPVDTIFYAGALGYAFTAALAFTSSDRAVQCLGPKRWRWLHAVGSYYLWFIFMTTYALGAAHSLRHLVLAVLFGLALVFKLSGNFFKSQCIDNA